MSAVGVDGCRDGWIAVVLRDQEPAMASFVRSIGELADSIGDISTMGIDIPIGLPDRSRRRSDVLARRALGPRASSLFYTPPAGAIEAQTYAEANAVCRQLTGGGLSRQAYNLRAKVLEVRDWLPGIGFDHHEVHPELSFSILLGSPARSSKKTWGGVQERSAALKSVGIDLDRVPAEVADRVGPDDILDAGAAAWTARRIESGDAITFPDPPEFKSDGISLTIWA